MGIPIEIVGEGIDWPAWVQAVGSVVAILFAANLIKLERLHQDVETMDAFKGVCFAVLATVNEVVAKSEQHTLDGRALHTFPMRSLNSLPEWLGQTPIFELRSRRAARMMLLWQRRLWELEAEISEPAAGDKRALDMVLIRQAGIDTRKDYETIEKWLRYRRWRQKLWLLPFATSILNRIFFPK